MELGLSMFEFMHEFWTIQCQYDVYMINNYTNMVVGKHGIQTFKVVVVTLLLLLLSFDIFILTNVHPLIFLNTWFVQYTYM